MHLSELFKEYINLTLEEKVFLDSPYMRGVTQGMNFMADFAVRGISEEDICWLVNESLAMRNDGALHPVFLDELRKRYKKHKAGPDDPETK